MKHRLIIDASTNRWIPDLGELFRYRDLFLTLAWRDFRVRYAQTTVGLLWAIIQPMVILFVLSLVFGRFVGVNTQTPHLLFTVAGTALWTYFSYVLTNSGSSIIASQNMVKKIYFPRIVIPLSKAVVGLIDLGISLLLMLLLMIYYQVGPSHNIWLAPVFVVIAIAASLSMGIWLSALSVRFRDFQHVVPFIVQIGLYVTPIAYPAEFATEHLPAWASAVYFLNPMAGVIQGFRWSVFGGNPPGGLVFVSISIVLLALCSGLLYFNTVQDEMADYV